MSKVLIIEDNHSTREHLNQIVKSISNDVEIYSVDNLKDAYCFAIEHRINLFIVDIILDTSRPGDSSGLKFVGRIREIDRYHFTPVIIITALEDPRICSYEKLHCYGYIEKPYDEKKVRDMVSKCLKYQECAQVPQELFFRKDGILYSVDPQEIVYIESIRHMLVIHTIREILEIPYITLKEVLGEINEYGFIQCRRNITVNRKYIANIDTTNLYMCLAPGRIKVEIGRSYIKNIKAALGVKS